MRHVGSRMPSKRNFPACLYNWSYVTRLQRIFVGSFEFGSLVRLSYKKAFQQIFGPKNLKNANFFKKVKISEGPRGPSQGGPGGPGGPPNLKFQTITLKGLSVTGFFKHFFFRKLFWGPRGPFRGVPRVPMGPPGAPRGPPTPLKAFLLIPY